MWYFVGVIVYGVILAVVYLFFRGAGELDERMEGIHRARADHATIRRMSRPGAVENSNLWASLGAANRHN